jgi:hypothetical protein
LSQKKEERKDACGVQGCMQAAAITLDCIVTVHYCGVFVVGRMQGVSVWHWPGFGVNLPDCLLLHSSFVPNNSSQTLAVGVSPFLVSFCFSPTKKGWR